MSAAAASVIDLGADALNATLAGKAIAAGAQFADVTATFKGHEIGSSDPWFNLSQDPVLANFNFHPTATGYQQGYTPAMTAQIRLVPAASH